MKGKEAFVLIQLLEPLVYIPDDIATKLSTDSSVACKLPHVVFQGKLEPEVASLLCGSLCHSRWFTAGLRCLMLYMSKYNLSEHDKKVMKQLSPWVTQVYLPMIFLIKVKRHIHDGPGNVLTLFRLWRQESKKAKEASELYMLSEAWCAHPEPLLVALLCSSDISERIRS